MTLDPNLLQIINGFTTSVLGKINRTISRKITTTFQDSDDVIPSSKLVKDEFATVRSEIPTKTSDLTNDGEDGSHLFIKEGDSRLTNSRNPNPHNQASSTITDTNTYSNIGNTLQNQASINSAINEKIGALMNLDIIEQVSTRPTASADTLNKIYAVPENDPTSENLFQYFVTVYENNAYKWDKIDLVQVDISGKVDKVEGKQLSTEDYTSAEKSKLANIEPEANKTIVDSTFINNSKNPVQSNIVYNEINKNKLIIEEFSLSKDDLIWDYWMNSENFDFEDIDHDFSSYTKEEFEEFIGEQIDYDEAAKREMQWQLPPGIDNNPVIVILNFETFEKEIIKYIGLKPSGTNSKFIVRKISPYNCIEKSSTPGLIKNDGTIDTNRYLTSANVPGSFNYGYVDSNLVLHLICVDGEVRVLHSIIQSGDPNIISAVITDKDNNPLGGVPVDFLFNGVKQGQSVNSDANGVATYNYTGTGAGEVDVQVRVGSFQSEIFVVSDCIFYDKGTLSDNHHWYNNDDIRSMVTRKEEYTEILYSSAYNRFQLTDKLNNDKVVFEFKTYESNNTDDYVIIQFDGGQNAISFGVLGITSTSDVRMEIEGNILNAYTNGVKKLNNYSLRESISNGNLRLGVNLNSDGIRVSDIKVYPI